MSSPRYALWIVRSTPEQDERLRLRLEQAVREFAGGSADAFGRLTGYTNGGYIREVLNKKKPVREALIERVHAAKGMAGWFLPVLSQVTARDIGGTDEAQLLAAFRALQPGSAARQRVLAYAQGAADSLGESMPMFGTGQARKELAA